MHSPWFYIIISYTSVLTALIACLVWALVKQQRAVFVVEKNRASQT